MKKILLFVFILTFYFQSQATDFQDSTRQSKSKTLRFLSENKYLIARGIARGQGANESEVRRVHLAMPMVIVDEPLGARFPSRQARHGQQNEEKTFQGGEM